jgi:negative regulator of sigma E activity
MTPSADAAEGVPSLAPASAGEVAAPVSSRLPAQLQKMQSAPPGRLDYSGGVVCQQAALMQTSCVTYTMAGKNELEKLEVLGDKLREYLCNNEEVACQHANA